MNRGRTSPSKGKLPFKFNAKTYVRPGLTEADVLQIKEQFDTFDREHIGSINPKELKNAIAMLGPQARAQGVFQVMLDLDSEGAGNISFQQFLHFMTPNLLTQDSRENINRIFALFDDEKTGFISIKSLRRAVNDLGLDYQEADLLEMVKRADEDGDGFISQEEFYRLISQYGV